MGTKSLPLGQPPHLHVIEDCAQEPAAGGSCLLGNSANPRGPRTPHPHRKASPGPLPTSDQLQPTEPKRRGSCWVRRVHAAAEPMPRGWWDRAELRPYPMYCSGWLWWMTILHVGQVLFSSRYFTRQLRQTARKHTPSESSTQSRRHSHWAARPGVRQRAPLRSPQCRPLH